MVTPLTWESLKGRHPAAASRKRALWRRGKTQLLSNTDGVPERVEVELTVGAEIPRDHTQLPLFHPLSATLSV